MDEKVKAATDQQNWKTVFSKHVSHFHFLLQSVMLGELTYG